MRSVMILLVALLTVACSGDSEAQTRQSARTGVPLDTVTFGGGCFWCVEEAFEVEGVLSTTSGYTGGHVASPT